MTKTEKERYLELEGEQYAGRDNGRAMREQAQIASGGSSEFERNTPLYPAELQGQLVQIMRQAKGDIWYEPSVYEMNRFWAENRDKFGKPKLRERYFGVMPERVLDWFGKK